MNRLTIIFLIFIVSSCKSIYKEINGVNKKMTFTSLVDYKNHVETKTNLDIHRFFFVDDKNYSSFLFDIANKKIVYYFGIIKNKKIIANGSNLKEKNNCYSAITNHIDNNYSNEETNIQSNLVDFSYYNFYKKKTFLNFDNEVIVFIYSYKLGKLTNTLEDLINDIEQNINIDYVILSLDNNDIIK